MNHRNNWSFTVKLISKETLRQFLKFRDMSYGQLAKRAGCSKVLIRLLATGKRTHTGVDIAKAICRELDVPVESLFYPTCLPLRATVLAWLSPGRKQLYETHHHRPTHNPGNSVPCTSDQTTHQTQSLRRFTSPANKVMRLSSGRKQHGKPTSQLEIRCS